MFKHGTVFVIGAGASVEFNLPSGAALKASIANKSNIRFDNFELKSGDPFLYRLIDNHCKTKGLDPIEFVIAGHKIKEAMPQFLSIDNFLDAHQNNDHIRFVGKNAIVQCILEAERGSVLYTRNGSDSVSSEGYIDTWLIPFAQRLFEGSKAEEISHIFDGISFIVFNYDRCLETALFYVLRNSFYLSSAEIAQIVSAAKIYHPYGSLGRLPWQLQSGSAYTCGFGEQIDERKNIELASQIKTFTERVEDQDLIMSIRKCYGSASKIVYLGFAYHDINMQLMQANNTASPLIYGTAFEMSPGDQIMSQRAIRQSLPGSPFSELTVVPEKCKTMLCNWGRSICFA